MTKSSSRNKPSQADTILKHLRRRNGTAAITSVEAIGLYGITRLAAVVKRLRDAGHSIVSTNKKGVNGVYSEYSLTPTLSR